MTNLKPLNRGDVPELESFFEGVESRLSFLTNSMLTMAHKPELVKTLVPMLVAVFGPGTVSQKIKQLAGFGVSHQAGSQYCVAHMTHGAVHAGISKDKIESFCEMAPPDLSPAEQAVLTVARGAAQSPNAVSAKDFAMLRDHFDDTQIVEIIAVIATMGFFNRWNDTMATQLEQPAIETVTGVLPEDGWSIGKHG